MDKCRRCEINVGTLYFDGNYNPTHTPVCQECLERLVRAKDGKGGHSPGYVGPGKDPDHDHLTTEQIDAQDWWNRQIRNIGEEE